LVRGHKFNAKLHKSPLIWERGGIKQIDKLESKLNGKVKLSIYDKRQNKYISQNKHDSSHSEIDLNESTYKVSGPISRKEYLKMVDTDGDSYKSRRLKQRLQGMVLEIRDFDRNWVFGRKKTRV
jgi:hypothetical protein